MWKCCPCFAKTYEAPEVLELDYRHSSLSEVPADVFTFERTLEKLDLGSNQISDLPPSLFHCHELKELDLCDNDLMTIPSAVGSLTRLCKLDLSRNAITEIADSIKNCKNLVYFDLSMNHLTKLPEGISQLVNLEELFLNDTYLEFLHANFGRLTKLKVLELRENAIQSLPKSMSRLHHLQRLDIAQNDISELPEVIGTMSNLTELWCDNNSIRSLPKFIGNLTKLNCLDASHNEIQGIAEEISKCTQLTDLTLSVNNIEALPNSFVKLENLTVLRLDCNSISQLPEEFGQMKNLQELSIVSNVLKSLPGSIGLLRKVHTMYLDDNLLTSLPKEIGSCTSLSVLSVAKNRLKEIVSEVGHLSSLKVFTLSGNLLVHLPVSLLNLPKLGALWLSESQSKPLLPLNKEIDPATGQHVLTCYLLPQLPYNGAAERRRYEEANDLPPRRSKPSIKFVTDMDPVPVEPTINKKGLLRAPTPYPKELRALAKHATYIRQSREHNGDVVNTDEPEYEGDYPEEGPQTVTERGDYPRSILTSVHKIAEGNKIRQEEQAGPSYASYKSNILPSESGPSKVDYKSPLPLTETIGLPYRPCIPPSTTSSSKGYTISNSCSSTTSSSNTSFTVQSKDNQENKQESKPTGPEHLDKSSRESYGNSTSSELARKSPPPYHVAARRAAFFRSSGGSGRVGSPTPDTRASPLVARIFPLPLPTESIPYNSSIASSVSSSAVPSPANTSTTNSVAVEGDNEYAKLDELDSSATIIPSNLALNQTYTVSRYDDNESDIVSSMEENLDTASSLDVPKEGTDSNNLVKTIESALESVDKRTTEFLRNDRWQDEEIKNSHEELAPTPPPPLSVEDEAFYSNLDQNTALPPPPPPPPENDVPISNTSDSTDGVMNFPPTLQMTGPLNTHASSYQQYPGISKNSSSTSRIPTFGVQKPSSIAEVKSSDSPMLSSPITRIPKLPSLTTSFQMQSPSSYGKKPEILSPKPTLIKTLNNTIPSHAVNDICQIKENNSSPVAINSTIVKSSVAIPRFAATSKIATNMNNVGRTSHSGIPSPDRNLNLNAINTSSSKLPLVDSESRENSDLKRIGSGSRIPKGSDSGRRSVSSLSPSTAVEDNSRTPSSENNNDIDENDDSSKIPIPPMTRIPSLGKKPWIFGTHKNARVVALEYRKVNSLGFTVSDVPAAGQQVDGQGVYVVATDNSNSTVKVGDKILQVDGIDVSNMDVSIVMKILSNCQENINLLVSRQS